MKLNTKQLRYLTNEDWRTLTAVETGSRNHELVPTKLIIQLSNLRSGSGVHKSISTLAKANLIARIKNAKYDGYRLTYGGLDYLALHAHLKQSVLYSLGSCIGTGKESDIYLAAPPRSSSTSNYASSPTQNPTPRTSTLHDEYVLKIHRLGRTSFRTVKTNRDYLRHRQSASWMYMSRLSAQKEFVFMKALKDSGFRVPEPIAWNRHTIIMSLIDGVPLRAVKEIQDPAALYGELMEIIIRLAGHGLIHGDFNEFNVMIEEREGRLTSRQPSPSAEPPIVEGAQRNQVQQEGSFISEANSKVIPWLIDFPQAVSIDHPNAQFYFERDVGCIKTFFSRRFNFQSLDPGPSFQDVLTQLRKSDISTLRRIDVEVEASGFSRKMAKELETYLEQVESKPATISNEQHEFDDESGSAETEPE